MDRTCPAEDDEGTRISVGLCTISGADRAVEDVLALARDAGYNGVELWGKDHVGNATIEDCRRIRELADRYDLEIPVYGSYLRCGSADALASADDELKAASALGCDMIRVWAGEQGYEDHEPEHWDRVVSDLERVTNRAGDFGVDVTVERHAGTLTSTVTGACCLIETVADDRCRLNYQPDLTSTPDAIAQEAIKLAPIASHVHLQAVRTPGEHDRCPLTDGYYNVESVLEPLVAAGYDEYVNVEFVTDDRPYRDVLKAEHRYLRSLLADID